MAYPTNFSNYTGSETLFAAGHAQDHNALEEKLGIGSSTPVINTSLQGTATGTSRWVANTMILVTNYGAVGDDSTDDTIALQNAINAANTAGGGIVMFPVGVYKITSALTMYSNIELRGVGMEISVIHQVTLNAHGLRGDGLSSISLTNIGFKGNGTGSTAGTGTGKGIYLTYGGAGNNPFHNFTNVMVRNWGSDGVYIQTAIVSNFEKVYSAYNGGNGFFWPEGGTSCSFNDCWARQNALAGYKFNQSVYQALNGCAADNNGANYMVIDAQSISFNGCGSEGALKNTGIYDGFGWYIDNSSIITLDTCWVTDNRNIGVWVTNGSNAITLNVADNTPNGTAVNFIKTDSGTNATIVNDHHTTANSLAATTTTIVNDGAGGMTLAGSLKVTGSSGQLTVSATTDGGEYNIGASAAGTLALYGSGGSTLHLNLLDGNLTVGEGRLIKATSSPPASAGATGTTGMIEWDSGFIYVCVATNTWKRVAIATWS